MFCSRGINIPRIFSVTTDGDPKIWNGLRDSEFHAMNHLRCSPHTIQLPAKHYCCDGNKADATVFRFISKATKIAGHFHHSSVSKKELKKIGSTNNLDNITFDKVMKLGRIPPMIWLETSIPRNRDRIPSMPYFLANWDFKWERVWIVKRNLLDIVSFRRSNGHNWGVSKQLCLNFNYISCLSHSLSSAITRNSGFLQIVIIVREMADFYEDDLHPNAAGDNCLDFIQSYDRDEEIQLRTNSLCEDVMVSLSKIKEEFGRYFKDPEPSLEIHRQSLVQKLPLA